MIGDALEALGRPPGLFSADKVWTRAGGGPAQIAETTRRWGVPRFDLLQVHNLLDWEKNLDTLDAMKETGRLRYTASPPRTDAGTTSLRRSCGAGRPDFVQLTYNIVDREAERRPAAARPRARDRRHLQPAIPARSPAGLACGPPDAWLGAGDRGCPPGRNSC